MVEVVGKIRGKARPRFTKGGRVYTAANTKEYEKQIKEAYIAAGAETFAEGEPLRAVIVAYYKKGKTSKLIHPTKKPDADNIAKIVLDALNGIAFKDDTQIIDLRVFKMWTYGEEKINFNIEKVVN